MESKLVGAASAIERTELPRRRLAGFAKWSAVEFLATMIARLVAMNASPRRRPS